MRDIRLIALDLDGTLFTSNKELTQRTFSALEAAARKGVAIVPATGRFYKTIPEAIKSMPFISYIMAINGATVKRMIDEKIIYSSEIPLDKAIDILTYLDTLNVAYDCYVDNDSFIPRGMMDHITDYIEDQMYLKMVWKYRNSVDELKEFLLNKGSNIQKMMAYTKDQSVRKMLLDTLGERFGDLSITSSIINNVEINDIGANKGEALKVIASDLGIEMGQVMAFGDSFNDIPMLKAAGVGVCMGNGDLEAKNAADMIAPSNDDDGVAQIIEKEVL